MHDEGGDTNCVNPPPRSYGEDANAKALRRNASLPERLSWNELVSLKDKGLKFRRQHPLYPYIADFACIEARLIIELDGQSHDTQLAYDAKREAVLRSRGWKVIRFSNDDVLNNLEGVVFTIINSQKLRKMRQEANL
jgi:very-short-patch-repair endonuclease